MAKTSRDGRAIKTQHRQELFIQHYLASNCNVGVACKESKVAEKTYRRWRDSPEFVERLEAARKKRAETFEDKEKRIIEEALSAIEAALKNPFDRLAAAIKILEAHYPEKWDRSVRKLVYERENRQKINPQPPIVSLRRGEPPARLKIVPTIKEASSE